MGERAGCLADMIWKSKCNILIEINNIIIIMEIQFILTCFKNSKSLSHKLYNITRMKEIIDFTYSFIQYQPSINSILLNSSITSFFII